MRRALKAMAAVLTLTGLAAADAVSQTLQEQQEYFLRSTCQNMGFGDPATEAAEPLRRLCTPCGTDVRCDIPPATPLTVSSSFSADATAGAEETAARRRKAVLGSEQDSTASSDSTLFSGNRYSVFFNLNYARSKQYDTTYEGGQKTRTFGSMLGLDRRIGTSGVVGISAQMEKQSGDFNSGGGFDKWSYGALLYGSWLAGPEFFVDISAGVKRRSMYSERVVAQIYTLPTSTLITSASVYSDGNQREVQSTLRSGYDLVSGGTSLGPRLAIEYRNVRTGTFVESGVTPLALAFDANTEKSLRSLAGLQASHVFTPRMGVFMLQLNVDWVHEFEDDQRLLSARFAQDLRATPSRLRYLDAPPDRDVLVGRASLAVTLPHGLAAFASIDALFGHSYRRHHGAALGVRKEL